MSGKIEAGTIAAAERLFGVRYTDAERAQMLGNIDAQVATAVRRRAVALGNALPPATIFDPRLPGLSMPAQTGMSVPLEGGALPGRDEDIAFEPVWRLAGWIKGGVLSSARLTEIYLARIARLNPLLFCFATVTAELARAQAARADALLARGTWLGPLHGIPYAVKDLVDTAGIVTGWGAEPFMERVPAADGAVVRRLAEAGAVLLGKASLGAMAFGDIWYGGTTRNPWNTEEGSRGSSAGSSSAAGAGLCGFAIGSETLGSIVIPAARCGVAGLRPSFGRVSRAGAMALCWSLDKLGPLARSVDDTALVLAAINGGDADDEGSIAAPFGWDAARGVDGMRVGFVPGDFGDPLDAAVIEAVRGVGAVPVPVALPDLPYDALQNLLFAEAAAAFEELTLTDADDQLARQDAGAWPNTFRKARFLSSVDHIQLDRLRRLVMQAMDAVFREVDTLLSPLAAGPLTIIGNMTGHPALALRVGFAETRTRRMPAYLNAPVVEAEGPVHRVPHAISILAPLFDEAAALTLGRALERSLGVADARPALD